MSDFVDIILSYEHSMKTATRSKRANSTNVAYIFDMEFPLPTKSIILKSAKNKAQLPNIKCQKLADPSWSKDFS